MYLFYILLGCAIALLINTRERKSLPDLSNSEIIGVTIAIIFGWLILLPFIISEYFKNIDLNLSCKKKFFWEK